MWLPPTFSLMRARSMATLPTSHKVRAISARWMKKWVDEEVERRRKMEERKGHLKLHEREMNAKKERERYAEGFKKSLALAFIQPELADRLVGKGISLTKVGRQRGGKNVQICDWRISRSTSRPAMKLFACPGPPRTRTRGRRCPSSWWRWPKRSGPPWAG